MRIRFHPCDLPYLCISHWHMSTPYNHPQRRILASVLLEVMPGFNLYLNSGGSFSYQHTVQPPTHGRLEMIKYGRGLAYYLPNFPVGANGDGVIATVYYCTGSRWNADHRVSRLGYLKGQVVKRVQKLVTFLYKWIWFHTCPPYAPLDFFLKSMPSEDHISRPPTPSSSQAVLEQQQQQRDASPEHFPLSPRKRSGWWMRNQARKVPKRALRWLGMGSRWWSMK